jgi:hypothetical protein
MMSAGGSSGGNVWDLRAEASARLTPLPCFETATASASDPGGTGEALAVLLRN